MFCFNSNCSGRGTSSFNNNFVLVPFSMCINGTQRNSLIAIPLSERNCSGCSSCGSFRNSGNSCNPNNCPGTIDVYYARQYALNSCGNCDNIF